MFQLGRKYIVGRQIITIREPAVKMLLLWSTHPYCDRKPIDEKVVQTLLMSSVSAEELEMGHIKEPLKIFIEGMIQTLKRLFLLQIKFHKSFFQLDRPLSDPCQRACSSVQRFAILHGRLAKKKESE